VANAIVPRHISLGRALWGMHALWAAALDKWQRENADHTEWSGIEFDKGGIPLTEVVPIYGGVWF